MGEEWGGAEGFGGASTELERQTPERQSPTPAAEQAKPYNDPVKKLKFYRKNSDVFSSSSS